MMNGFGMRYWSCAWLEDEEEDRPHLEKRINCPAGEERDRLHKKEGGVIIEEELLA